MPLAVHATVGVDLEHFCIRGGLAQDTKAGLTRPVAPGIFIFLGVRLSSNYRAELDQLEGVAPVPLMFFLAPSDVDRLADINTLAVEHKRIEMSFAGFVFLRSGHAPRVVEMPRASTYRRRAGLSDTLVAGVPWSRLSASLGSGRETTRLVASCRKRASSLA